MSKEIGLRIKQLREQRGLTQRQFAAFLDIASSSISQFEAGRNVPGGEMLTKLHTKLGFDINWLLTGTPAAGAEDTQPAEKADLEPNKETPYISNGSEGSLKQFLADSGINCFGDRLKEAMLAKGIATNVKLAGMTGMSETVIRSYISGRTMPALDRLAMLAYACDCSISWLATGEEEKIVFHSDIDKKNENRGNKTDQASPLFNLLKTLTPDEQEQIYQMLGRYGVNTLVKLLDDDYLSLLDLEGTALKTALLIKLLPESQRKEILAFAENGAKQATIIAHRARA